MIKNDKKKKFKKSYKIKIAFVNYLGSNQVVLSPNIKNLKE